MKNIHLYFDNLTGFELLRNTKKVRLELDISEGWGVLACKLINTLCQVSGRKDLIKPLQSIFIEASPRFEIIEKEQEK